ncbi:MAG: response regulator [Kofleriaceae bacterium]|nr:MAG: response regulator [Kofleriaceae bacterium]MBZ0232709.1 CoA-binding protein [Kofleriaceae bacterium]
MEASRDRDGLANILIVDDTPAHRLALEAVLEPLGQNVLMAGSGDEALRLLEQHDCALVLMDAHMPVLDGYETVETLRRRAELRHLPVMFLTAMFCDREHAARSYALGAVDFITKPFEPSIVKAKVRAFVTLYQYHQRLKQQERRLASEVAAREAAEKADRLKEEFIAVLGHDLRTPLSAILFTAQRHADARDASGPCRMDGRRIAAMANRMGRMIDHVVDYTRSRLGGGLPIAVAPADLAELCRAPLDEIQAIYPESVITLVVDGDTRGVWDADRVLQVFANLVGNAVRHGDGTVRVSLIGVDAWVILEVRNGGEPIPANAMAHLFEPFRPGEGSRGGLGLGLYIVERIVHAHGGSIRAESSSQLGTTFTVRWPRYPAGHEDSVSEPHHNPSDAELRALLESATTIAIVGASSNPDRPSNEIMQLLLDAGYRVIPVNPRETEVLGQRAVASLADIGERVDIVDVFRRSEDTPAIAAEAVAIGARALWLQEGVSNEDAAARARAGGLTVVMDRCIGVTHRALRIAPKR